jgi:hypothetical protein
MGKLGNIYKAMLDSQNKASLLFQATAHMENCIGTLHRAFNHLTKLRNHLHKLRESSGMPIPEIGWKAVPKNRATERDSIRHIRDTIEHMHEWILRDDAGSGRAPIGLVIMSDSIELGNTVIYYEDLATWIERAYEVARPLVSYVQPTS